MPRILQAGLVFSGPVSAAVRREQPGDAFSTNRSLHVRLSLARDPAKMPVRLLSSFRFPMTDNNRSVFILGGARSGKSRFAEELAIKAGGNLHYLATGRAWDDEMRDRIAHHQARRGGEWTTHEAPVDIAAMLERLDRPDNVVLVDCLTLWLTNLMMENADFDAAFAALEAAILSARAKLIFVSNEVGLGIVPENRMAREFRDHAGRLHQRIAAIAGEVFFVAAGLPLKMKG